MLAAESLAHVPHDKYAPHLCLACLRRVRPAAGGGSSPQLDSDSDKEPEARAVECLVGCYEGERGKKRHKSNP